MRLSKKRKDLISFQKLENIKDFLGISFKDVADIIGISASYMSVLRAEGQLSYMHYQTLINAIKQQLADDYFRKIKIIDDITNSTDD